MKYIGWNAIGLGFFCIPGQDAIKEINVPHIDYHRAEKNIILEQVSEHLLVYFYLIVMLVDDNLLNQDQSHFLLGVGNTFNFYINGTFYTFNMERCLMWLFINPFKL